MAYNIYVMMTGGVFTPGYTRGELPPLISETQF